MWQAARLMSVFLALLSAVCYGTADFSGGLATRRGPVQGVLVLSQSMGLLIGVGASWLILPGQPDAADVLWGCAAGLAGALGLAALYHGLGSTLMAVVSPVAAATGAIVPVVFGHLTGERPGPVAWVGVILALASIAVLTYEPGTGGQTRVRGIGLGLAAGLGFGLFFVFISRTRPESGLWPLVTGRIVSVVFVALLALLTRRTLAVGSPGRRIAVLAGILDMAANVFFLMAVRSGLLMISTVVTSLYPAPTVFLSVLILKERLTVPRVAGLVLAVCGVALMTV